MLSIATWNVNSLRVRLPQVLDWLEYAKPDILALQEIKLTDENFPLQEIQDAGYEAVYCGQKTYNGVAILSKAKAEVIATALPDFEDPQKRVLAAKLGPITLVNLYVPNGSEIGSDKYAYKLDWLTSLRQWLKKLQKDHKNLAVVGDFNIAPTDDDVHDPEEWQGKVLVSELERQAFQQILDQGLTDCFRLFEQEPATFSWWDYRAAAFRRNRGLRIDHILADQNLSRACKRCFIDKNPRTLERPSDHTPVVAIFDL